MTNTPAEKPGIEPWSSGAYPSIVVNATNLHYGGGIQVATSLIMELSSKEYSRPGLQILISSEVAENLSKREVDWSRFASVEVLDVHGVFRGRSVLSKRLKQADAVFTVFGPLYLWSKPRLSIVGFAQPWIIYPENDAYRKLSLLSRLRTRIKFALQRETFRHSSDYIFVEADHVRDRLIRRGIFEANQVFIVPNCLNDVFFIREDWETIEVPKRDHRLRFGLVTRDYPHKNLDVLPTIRSILSVDHGLDVDFLITLTEEEWSRRSESFRGSLINVGPLTISQCPSFYESLDGVIFPSLLECFSATPLEAMYMRKPLFASDRPFVRDFCGDYPWYFDPNSPQDAAKQIAQYAASDRNADRLNAAHRHVLSLPNARDRVSNYMSMIMSLLE